MNRTVWMVLWGVALSLIPALAPAQQTRSKTAVCATPDLTDAQRREISDQAMLALRSKLATNGPATTVTYVPIRPHVFRRSNGTGGMTLTKMNNVMAITNSYYLTNGSGIQFYFCGTTPDYIDNDAQYNGFVAFDETVANGRDAPNAMNQYYVNQFSKPGLGGYAYFPADQPNSTRSFILNEDDEADLANRLLPHELGHNFGMFHTQGNTNPGTTELVTRQVGANCLTTGDELCDTPADPFGLQGASTTAVSGCPVYNGTVRDANGALYTPSVSNIMSYYFPCTHDFTLGQQERAQAGLALRESHTTYSLNCPATVVAAPGNLSAAIVNASVVLTWTDNAANEMGYFVERSTSATTGFVPVGGVGTDMTTFTDPGTASLTVYHYRIRPSNATTAGLSAVVSIRTGICRPRYSNGCALGDGLDGLVVNRDTLSKSSGCSVSSYQSYSATSTTLTAGQSYSFTGTLISLIYDQGVTVWADLNRNGVFEANHNELVYQTPVPQTGKFSGTLTLPASLTAGPLSVRVVVRFDGTPLDPCGSYEYGETEDYEFPVVRLQPPAQADLSLSLRVNNRTAVLNQPVGYRLTITNNGPANATSVGWINRLPTGLTFISGDVGVVGSATAVTGSGLSLSSGASVTINYQLQPTQSGTYINTAQILSSGQPDPDSQPDSGTGDGQDDAASADIRTMTGSGSLFVSPNPNQTTLPPVASNQPAPDPAKADLSVGMATSSRTPALGQPVMFTIIIRNTGGMAATNVVVRDTMRGLTISTLPAGMTAVGSGIGYTIIQGTVASIAADGTATLTFTATATTRGYVRNAVQIWSADQPDPDSTPGSLTPAANNLNGEDDTALIDFRTGS